MRHDTETLRVSESRTVVRTGLRILLIEPPQDWRILFEDARLAEARFVRISPDLGHLAWWHRPSERFHLAKIGGGIVWERRINTDKADALDIRFSPSGDAVACFDEYDGGYRVHLYSIAKADETDLGPSLVPICCDPELRRFACVEPGARSDPFSPPASACNPDVLTIRDRRGTVRGTLRVPADRE